MLKTVKSKERNVKENVKFEPYVTEVLSNCFSNILNNFETP